MLRRKVGDEWRQSTKAWVKVNGTWKEVKSLYKKEDGTWNKVSGITTVNQVYQQFYPGSGVPVQQPATFVQPFQTPNPPAQQPVPAQQPFFFSQPFSTQSPYPVNDSGLFIQHLWYAQPTPSTRPFSYQQINASQQPSNASTTPGGVECADGPVGPSPGSFVPFASTPNPTNQLSPENNGICYPIESFVPSSNQVPRPVQSPYFEPRTCFNQQPVTYSQPSPPYQAAPFTPIQQPVTCPRQTPVVCDFTVSQPRSVTSTPGGTPYQGGTCFPFSDTVFSITTYQQDGTPLTCTPVTINVPSAPAPQGGTPYPGGRQCIDQPNPPAQQPQPPAQQPQPPAQQPQPPAQQPQSPLPRNRPRPPLQVPRPPAQVPAPPAQVARPPVQVAVPPSPIQCPYQQIRGCPRQTPNTCTFQFVQPRSVQSTPGGTPYPLGRQCVPFSDNVTSFATYQQDGTPVSCNPNPIQQGTNYTTIEVSTIEGGVSCPNTAVTPTGQPIRRTTPSGTFTPGICYPNLIPFPCQIEFFTPTSTQNTGTLCVPGNTGPGPSTPWTPSQVVPTYGGGPFPGGPYPSNVRVCFPVQQPTQQPVQNSRSVTQWNPVSNPIPVTVTPEFMPGGRFAPAQVIAANPTNCGPTSPVGAGKCGVQPFEEFIIAKTAQTTVGSGGLTAPSVPSTFVDGFKAPDGKLYSRYRQTGPINPTNPVLQEHPGPGEPVFNWNPDAYTPPTAQSPFPVVPGGTPIPGPPGTVVPSTFASGGEYSASPRQYNTAPGGVRCFKIDPVFDFGDNSNMTDVSIRGSGSVPTGTPISYPNVSPNPNGPSNVGICFPTVTNGTNQVESFTNVQTTPSGVQCGPSAQNTQCFPVQQPVSPFAGTNQVTTTPAGVSCPPGSVTQSGQPIPRSAPGLCYPIDLGIIASGCASTTRLRNIWR